MLTFRTRSTLPRMPLPGRADLLVLSPDMPICGRLMYGHVPYTCLLYSISSPGRNTFCQLCRQCGVQQRRQSSGVRLFIHVALYVLIHAIDCYRTNSLFILASYASSTPSVAFDDARVTAEEQLTAYHKDVPAPVLKYFGMEDGSAALVHAFQLKGESGEWLEALVDAHSGKLVSMVDYVSHATVCPPRFSSLDMQLMYLKYRVVPVSKASPLDGFETIVDPEDTEASPNGWHSIVANKDLEKTMYVVPTVSFLEH